MSTEKIRKTGGNNVPLVEQEADAICIAGNTVDRQPQNGGNGLGCQDDLAYTLTATDRHAVYSRQRVDDFRHNDVASTQSARQYKDATDLICQQAEACAHLIRRLTPLECERLQGFPDGWTDIPNASDSARYKALPVLRTAPVIKRWATVWRYPAWSLSCRASLPRFYEAQR